VKIAIIGHGTVGGALSAWLTSRQADVTSYDPPKGLGSRAALDAADVVLVCVPTPYAPGTGFDRLLLDDAIAAIIGAKLVVIKSTVTPGTTDALQAAHPQHRFVFNPEFLREAHAVADMAQPDRQVLGVTAESAGEADMLLSLLPPAPFVRVCTAREAEMAKYAANSFLAVKVSFANEIADLCERTGIGFDAVRDIVGADARIGASHLDVLADGYRGYGGKCLPKDSKALLDLAARHHAALDVLAAADRVNERIVAPKRAHPRVQQAAATVRVEQHERRAA
jgi:UDPglucose 6-dehydrogenase